MKTRSLFVGALAAALAWCSPVLAAPILIDAEKGIAFNVGVFLQPQLQMTSPLTSQGGSAGIGAPDGVSPSFDLFLRRTRLMVWGSVTPQLSFFVETEQANIGKGGRFDSSTFIQDAFLTYAFSPGLKLDAGMMLVPFSRHTIEGAIGLHAIDYHAQLIRFPAGKIFRDTGVQLRGLLLDDRLHYRIGLFEGVRNSAQVFPPAAPVDPLAPPVPPIPPLNDNGLPRLTAQVRYNLMGSEPDFFLKGIYFSPTPLVSFGVGVDVQADGVYVNNAPATYFALNADAFVEYPFSVEDELLLKLNVFYYAHGRTLVPESSALPNGGGGFFLEAGFRHGWVEPLVYLEYLRGGASTLEIVSPHIGANFWLIQHNFNLKLDFGYRHTNALNVATGMVETTEDVLATLQTQLYF